MGWYISPYAFSMVNGGVAATLPVELIAFPEIDGDEGIIAQDKSNWFIKRLIVAAHFGFVPDGAQGFFSTHRTFSWMFATAKASDAAEVASAGTMVNEPDGWDAMRRVIRTGKSPAYNMYKPRIEFQAGSTQSALSTEAAGSLSVPQWRSNDNLWGPSMFEFDLEVSNAGLVPDSSLYFFVSQTDQAGPVGNFWEDGDRLDGQMDIRVLLQKRRG